MAEFADKAYRDAYVGSQIRMTLPLQIRGLREGFGWTQATFASEAHMAQPRISELETPGERRLTIETLLRLASAFDIALQVRFLPFSELVEWNEGLELNNLRIKSFSEELQEAKKVIAGRRRHRKLRQSGGASNIRMVPAGDVGRVSQFNLFEQQTTSVESKLIKMPKNSAATARLFTLETKQSAESDLGLLAVAGNKVTGATPREYAYGNR